MRADYAGSVEGHDPFDWEGELILMFFDLKYFNYLRLKKQVLSMKIFLVEL